MSIFTIDVGEKKKTFNIEIAAGKKCPIRPHDITATTKLVRTCFIIAKRVKKTPFFPLSLSLCPRSLYTRT